MIFVRKTRILFRYWFILILIALTIQILAVILPYWYHRDFSSSVRVYGGMLLACAEVGTSKNCGIIIESTGWYLIIRIFEFTGLFTMLAALIQSLKVQFRKDMKKLKKTTWILCFCSSGFIIIGVLIYIATSSDYLGYYSWALPLTTIGGLIILGAGSLCYMDWKKHSLGEKEILATNHR